jgi:hypothetical protein
MSTRPVTALSDSYESNHAHPSTHSPEGVDLTLIRWMLSLGPLERLEALQDFLALLEVLQAHEVDCIVVGGVSGVLHGAPITTFDLDVVHARSSQNLDRLIAALDDLEAYARGQDDSATVALYEDLLPHTVEMRVGTLPIKVIHLDTLIDLKEETGHDKDAAVIAILKRTRQERSKPEDR